MTGLIIPVAGITDLELSDIQKKLEEMGVAVEFKQVELPYMEAPVLVHLRAFRKLNREDPDVCMQDTVVWLPAGESLSAFDRGFCDEYRGPESLAQLPKDFACPLKFEARRVGQDGDWERYPLNPKRGQDWKLFAVNMMESAPRVAEHLPVCATCQEAYLEGVEIHAFYHPVREALTALHKLYE